MQTPLPPAMCTRSQRSPSTKRGAVGSASGETPNAPLYWSVDVCLKTTRGPTGTDSPGESGPAPSDGVVGAAGDADRRAACRRYAPAPPMQQTAITTKTRTRRDTAHSDAGAHGRPTRNRPAATAAATNSPTPNAASASVGPHQLHTAPKSDDASNRATAVVVLTTARPVVSCCFSSTLLASAESTPSVAA